MKTRVTAALALLLTLLAAGSAHAQRTLNERRAVVADGFIRIFVPSGLVTVIGWDQDSMIVTGTVWEPAGENFVVGVTAKGAKIGLWTDADATTKPSNIVVHVPKRSQVWVKTADGNISVSAVNGGLDLFSVSGAIQIAGTPSEVYAESMAGDINLNVNTASARIKTASGALRVSGSITDLTAVTVSGSVDVVKSSYVRARLESVDGDIRFAGNLPAASMLDITNHSGGIDLRLNPKVSAAVAVSVYSATLSDEFGIAKKLGSMKAREVTFALGQKPSAHVTLRSFKGKIFIGKT